MSSTEKQNGSIKIVASVFILVIFYGVLVIADYIVASALFTAAASLNGKAVAIEAERARQEDLPQRLIAISEGFKPIFYPDMLDSDTQIRAIAEKYNVAPLAPQANLDLYYCNEGYSLLKYRTDKFGFRNNNKVWGSSADIVLIGDSFTHGACVDEAHTIAGYLESSLSVINLGTASNNPIHYAALAKIFLPVTKPKYVALIFYANDNDVGTAKSYFYKYFFVEKKYSYFSEFDSSSLNPNIMLFYEDVTRLIMRKIDKGILEGHVGFFERGPIFERAVRYLSLPSIRDLISSSISPPQKKNELDFGSRLAIEELAAACREFGCKPIVVYIPNSEFWRPDPRARTYENSLGLYASELSISFLSAREELQKVKANEAYAIKGPHLSPLGYSIIAKGIKELADLTP
jgi:hypothetical protein